MTQEIDTLSTTFASGLSTAATFGMRWAYEHVASPTVKLAEIIIHPATLIMTTLLMLNLAIHEYADAVGERNVNENRLFVGQLCTATTIVLTGKMIENFSDIQSFAAEHPYGATLALIPVAIALFENARSGAGNYNRVKDALTELKQRFTPPPAEPAPEKERKTLVLKPGRETRDYFAKEHPQAASPATIAKNNKLRSKLPKKNNSQTPI